MATARARTFALDRLRRHEWLRALRRAVRGFVITPDVDGYDELRRGYNAAVDRHPAAILQCLNDADVASGIIFARENDVPLSVRGAGHSLAGFGMCTGGLALDLSRMKTLDIDPTRMTVRSGPGVTWGEMDRATSPLGFVTPGARISTTGVAGVTLGGGLGWLMRRHGLSIDSMVGANVVTAEGNVATANSSENPDLFWGLRGGGGNFGVVTSMAFRLRPIAPLVTGGAAFYAAERFPSLLRFYRDMMRSASDDLGAQCNFLIAPDAPFVPAWLRGVPVAAIAVCHSGHADDANREVLMPLRDFGEPLLGRIRPMPFTTVQRLYDAAGTFGYHVYGRAGLLSDLSDDVLDIIATFAPRVSSPLSIVMLSALGGAVARIGPDETAFAHRRCLFDLSITAVWDAASDGHHHVAWVEEFWRAVAPMTSGVYVNELGDEGRDRVAAAYPGATYDRLVSLKNRFDPDNLFRVNHNVIPTTSRFGA